MTWYQEINPTSACICTHVWVHVWTVECIVATEVDQCQLCLADLQVHVHVHVPVHVHVHNMQQMYRESTCTCIYMYMYNALESLILAQLHV